MAKYELSIAKDYVPGWDYVDGVREIFQNALDQETESENNEMFFDYSEEEQVLRIGNKTSVLDVSTLLLGASTKSGNEDLIGQFGEGYKIATLVLTREGHNVVFYNYGAKEVWRPRFVNSRRYKAEVLTFFVDKKFVWQSVPNNDLVIEIDNITKEKYEYIVESNLHLQEVGKAFNTSKGDVLLDGRYKGKIYVNGLYICTYDKYDYGYNFKPSKIKIDRDRKLVDDFDLRWLASQMWMEDKEEMRETATELISKGASDVEYVQSVGGFRYKEVSQSVGDKFFAEYGENAVPVSTQEEIESVANGFKPIVVSETYKKSVESSGKLERKIVYVQKKSAKEQLQGWMGEYGIDLEEEAVRKFEDILRDMED